ncbi:MAG: CooT family nickel-binding protein [Candidatus Hydrothermarchaeota archaeon]
MKNLAGVDMCEAKVYILEGGKRETVMEDVVSVREEGGSVIITGLMGERKEVPGARVVEVRMEPGEVLLKRLDRASDED